MGRMTVAQVADQVQALEQGQVAIMQALAKIAGTDEAEPKPKASRSRKSKPKASESKPREVKRDLDPIQVALGEVTFRVASTSPAGRMYSAPRVVPLKSNGSSEKSWTADHVRALAEDSDAILAAMDEVAERAKIGDHAPAE